MHNLELTEDQSLIVDTVSKFVADAVAPTVLELDEHRQFARDGFAGLAELGMFGLCVSEAAGGAGMGLLPLVGALQCVGEQSASLGRLWLGQAQAAAVLELAGDARLEAVMGGAMHATFVGPEYGCELVAGQLQGTAELVAGGEAAELLLVAARSGAQWVVVAVESGAVLREPLRSLGLASAGCARLRFAGVVAQTLAVDAGAALARAALLAQIGSAALAVGGGCACVVAARRHASERIAFGKPLLAQQAVADKLVEATRLIEAARHLTWHAARRADRGEDASQAAMLAKLSACEAMVFAADEAIQIHGGFGYTVEYHVERHYRDAKTLEVLDGGNGALRAQLAERV